VRFLSIFTIDPTMVLSGWLFCLCRMFYLDVNEI
jgi:hypothetical protein